ncbi:hypothetical protein U1Q18_050848 [Sarracenia purpurea var. burkii]
MLVGLFIFCHLQFVNLTVETKKAEREQFYIPNELGTYLRPLKINLSPRPMPVTHISTWSSSCQSYPIRRSVSAFGFQQKTEEHGHHVNRSRPLSADNIRYVNRQNFVDDYRSEITISSRNRSRDEDMAETSTLSGNIYENILNRYSENKLVEQYAKRESVSNLKPGLSSKPPLPPFADIKMHANKSEPEPQPQPEPEPETVEQTVESDENLKTAAEREAFDEIIALKFQRWFPNTTGLGHDHMEGSSSGDGEIDDVELVSYKERNYKTCEYRRYEVHRKNTTRKIAETGNGDTNASKHGVKKRRPPKGKVVSSTKPSFDNDAARHSGHRKHSACETDAIATSQPLDNGNGDGDCDNASQINQQRDGRKLADKADELRKKKSDHDCNSYVFVGTGAGASTKSKLVQKIKFSIALPESVEKTEKNFVFR